MAEFIGPVDRLDLAWATALQRVNNSKGHVGNLILIVDAPEVLDAAAGRAAVDQRLRSAGNDGVSTVANTIFPASLYNPPPYSWSKSLAPAQADELDQAAEDLFGAYNAMLPLLRTFDGNHSGTYFSRLMSWPGKEPNGLNQLATRIHYMRGKRNQHAGDLAIGGEGEIPLEENIAFGLQEYKSTDRRLRAFPCLVHINLSAVDGVLSMTAVYRNWYMVTRGYGNLVGLSRIQCFLAQQCGLAVGELIIHAGHATVERSDYGGKSGIDALAKEVIAAAQSNSIAVAA